MKKLLKNEKLEGGIIYAPLYFFEPIGGQNKTLLSHFQDELLGDCHIQKRNLNSIEDKGRVLA